LGVKYSHTLLIVEKYWIKAGLGLSLNSLNTNASSFRFPDQYTNYGFTGMPSQEIQYLEGDKVYYPSFSAGIAAVNNNAWLSVSVDNLNRPSLEVIGEKYPAPLIIVVNWGMMIPINKNKRPRRIFALNGGLEPYSSIGPVASFRKDGAFHSVMVGVNAFTNPVFWGVSFRYNSVYDNFFTRGTAAMNFMAGYRSELWAIAYSYDFMLTRTDTNFKGAHEISLSYYLFSVKPDYKKNKLFPFPNQLMY
jgi:type IX secretion system PorP/SprF family membrane protein